MIRNICTRCGKERIISKTWEEKIQTYVGITLIQHTETVCPDPKCQRMVEKDLKEKRERMKKIKDKEIQRKNIRKKQEQEKRKKKS